MQKTRAVAPAYDAYDEGRQALADEQVDTALTLANKAIDLFPAEAHFYALRGDARLLDADYGKAVTNYDSAIRRRDDFFYYYLQRGLAKKSLGQTNGAAVDLERSIDMLPTAPAHYELGNIEAGRGDSTAAIAHYRAVAKSGGDYGKSATAKLVRLELPSNPGSYVPRRCDADANGNLIVSVKNDTPVTIVDVQLLIQYADGLGRQQQIRQAIRGAIRPGQIASLNTGLGPYTGGTCPAQVVAARVAE